MEDQFNELLGGQWSRVLNMCIRGDLAALQTAVVDEQAFTAVDPRLKQAAFETAINCSHLNMVMFIYNCQEGGDVEVYFSNVLAALADEDAVLAEYLLLRSDIGIHDKEDFMFKFCVRCGHHNARAWLTSLHANYEWPVVD